VPKRRKQKRCLDNLSRAVGGIRFDLLLIFHALYSPPSCAATPVSHTLESCANQNQVVSFPQSGRTNTRHHKTLSQTVNALARHAQRPYLRRSCRKPPARYAIFNRQTQPSYLDHLIHVRYHSSGLLVPGSTSTADCIFLASPETLRPVSIDTAWF
jgi:hypothetical protein